MIINYHFIEMRIHSCVMHMTEYSDANWCSYWDINQVTDSLNLNQHVHWQYFLKIFLPFSKGFREKTKAFISMFLCNVSLCELTLKEAERLGLTAAWFGEHINNKIASGLHVTNWHDKQEAVYIKRTDRSGIIKGHFLFGRKQQARSRLNNGTKWKW